MRPWPAVLASSVALCVPAAGRAEDVVQTADTTVSGEIVEVVRGDYVLVQDALGDRQLVRWDQIRAVWTRKTRLLEGPNVRSLPERWPVRPTAAVTAGVCSLLSDPFRPYFGQGALIGASAGLAFSPSLALVAGYQHGWPSGDERNPETTGSTDAVNAMLRVATSPRRGGVGLYGGFGAGLRWMTYRFRSEDSSEPIWHAPGGTLERAWLSGQELRFAFGMAITLDRQFTTDLSWVLMPGRVVRYRDTLACETFLYGRCGGGYSIGYVFSQVELTLRWN